MTPPIARGTKLPIRWPKENYREVGLTKVIRVAGVALVFLVMICLQLPASAASVTLSWMASTNNNIAGYNIYYGGAAGDYTNEVGVSDVTNATISGLLPGATYYFAATTRDVAGNQSGFSNVASYSIPALPTLALASIKSRGAVTALNITANGTVPAQWALQASSDLKNWTTIALGTNTAVNLSVPVNSAVPAQFFRLEGE